MHRLIDQATAIATRSMLTVGRLGRLFTTILALSLLSIWLLFASILYESYTSEWKSASLFVNNVDALLEQAIARNIERFDASLKATMVSFADPNTMTLTPKLRQRVLFDQSVHTSGLGSVLITDKTGKVIADSQSETPRDMNAADRDYFKVHVDGTFERELFIGHPFESRLQANMWVIGISRRIEDARGGFAGVVVGSVKLSYLARLFGTVNMPPGSTITIIHDDGTILMRSPFADIGRSLKDKVVFKEVAASRIGETTAASAVDGVERLIAFRRIGRSPMMLTVGIPTRYFLVSWRWRIAFIAFGFSILSGLIVVLAVTLGSELHRRAIAERTLSDLAATDGLTALANRRHFDEVLETEWRRAIRERTPLALLMIDGDYFKAFNDTYGHIEGDAALRAIAEALRDSIQRPADLVARFGGEEFAVLLPGTDLDGALLVGETMRLAVARLDYLHLGSPLRRLSVSIGVASCLPESGGSALSLVQAADFALYEAKETGRDRIATGENLDLPNFGWRANAREARTA